VASQRIRRIGVLTGGGDCPGLNAVIRAVVKTAVREYNLSVIGFENGFGGLIQNRARELTEKDVVGILPRGGTILGTTNRDNPFHYPVTIKGKTEFRDVSDRVIENINIHNKRPIIPVPPGGRLLPATLYPQRPPGEHWLFPLRFPGKGNRKLWPRHLKY
jgi:hypothetical protein